MFIDQNQESRLFNDITQQTLNIRSKPNTSASDYQHQKGQICQQNDFIQTRDDLLNTAKEEIAVTSSFSGIEKTQNLALQTLPSIAQIFAKS